MSTNRLHAQADGGPRVLIASKKPGLRVPAILGNARRTGGWGGWEVINRVRQVGFIEWQTVEPAQMEVSIVLDGLLTDTDQEPFVRNLERMATPQRAAGNQPPPITIRGAVPAHAKVKWVIRGLDWSEEAIVRRSRDGHRIQQGVTLDLIQYVQPELAFTRSAAQRAAMRKPKVVTITARKGDTLALIAKRELDAVGRWTDIRDLNPKLSKDPRREIKAGTKVRVPAK